MDKYVGLVGKIGPVFDHGKASSGEILIAEPENDSTWQMLVPGSYFKSDYRDRLRAAFDHLVRCEDN